MRPTYAAHINTAEPQHAGARAGGGDVLGDALSLLDVAADDAGVGAQVDEGAGLGAADGAGAAGDEEDAAGWGGVSGCFSFDGKRWGEMGRDGGGGGVVRVGEAQGRTRTKDAGGPDVAEVLGLGDRHCVWCGCGVSRGCLGRVGGTEGGTEGARETETERPREE